MKHLLCMVLCLVLLLSGTACGSPSVGPTPTPIPTVESTPTPVPTTGPTPMPMPTAKPTPTPVPTAEPTPTPVPTAKPTPTPVPTAEPTPTPVPTVEPTPTPTPTPVPTPTLPDYDPIIDYYELPFAMGAPQYSVQDIRQMIQDDLGLDEMAAKLSTLADVVQYLHQKGYSADSRGDLRVEYQELVWHSNRSPQTVFSENIGNCGGGSNLINYLLQGDYDEQGYVQEAANQGGHVYNYFKLDGVYYFFDMTQIVHSGTYDHRSYRIFATTDPLEFSEDYIQRNHSRLSSNDPHYLLFHYLYPWEGPHLPVAGNPNCRTVLRITFSHILSRDIEDTIKLLYVAEEKYAPIFTEAPPQSVIAASKAPPQPLTEEEVLAKIKEEEISDDTIILQYHHHIVKPGNGFGSSAAELGVYLHGQRITEFTFTFSDPSIGECAMTEEGKLSIRPTGKVGDSWITITAGDVTARFRWHVGG